MRVEQGPLGFVLAEPALDGDGRPLAPTGAEVTQEVLEELRKEGVQHVFVEDPAFDGLRISMMVSRQTLQMTTAAFEEQRRRVKAGEARGLPYRLFAQLARAVEEDTQDLRLERSMILQPANERQRDIIHALNRAALSTHLANSLGMHRYRLEITMAALIADVGMWTLPAEILEKNAALTDTEHEIVEQHVEQTLDLLSPADGWSAVTKTAVYQHHERLDGSGYPRHLTGPQIHAVGRLLAICDVFSAVSLLRPGRKLYTPAEAVELLLGGADSQFDFDQVSTFHQIIPPFPVGSEVVLSTGEHAVVVEVPENFKSRPKLRVFTDSSGRRRDTFQEIDLSDRRRQAVTIVGVEH